MIKIRVSLLGVAFLRNNSFILVTAGALGKLEGNKQKFLHFLLTEKQLSNCRVENSLALGCVKFMKKL
jgi:hypothetical protein